MKIIDVKRLNNSYAGNPKFLIVTRDYKGNVLVGKTKTNSSLGYVIDTHSVGRNYDLKYHTTRNGNVIFDSVNNKKNKIKKVCKNKKICKGTRFVKKR